jgi:hypothetical protein
MQLTRLGRFDILPLVSKEGGIALKACVITSCVIVLLAWSACYAVEPATKPQEPTTQSGVIYGREEGGPLPFPEQMVVGDVKDSSGNPVGGVAIKLFADGHLVEIAHTTSAGSYEMRLPLSVETDETVIMWFVAGTDQYLPQNVVLKQSSRANRIRLFSECAMEVKMRPQMRVDVTVMTESEFLASLKVKDCL